MYDQTAGWLAQDEEGYHFVYDPGYLKRPHAESISLTMPLRESSYNSLVMFPFFDGLIPEGWLLDIAQRNWKLNTRSAPVLLTF